MKLTLSILALSLLTSCGRVLKPDELLNPTKGLAKDERVDDLEDRVKALELRLEQAYQDVNTLSQSIGDISVNQDILQQTVALNTSRIVELELALDNSNETVQAILDPCGDKPGSFDEVLIKLSNGDIIAYMSDNGGYLTVLPNGSYRTTDSQECKFNVVNGELVNERL